MWHVIWSKSIWMFATHKVQSMSKVQQPALGIRIKHWLHCLTLTESLIDQIIMGNQVTKRTHSTITTSDLIDSLHGKSSHERDYHSTFRTISGHINYDWLWITFLVVQCSDHCQSATAPGPGSDSGQALLFICQQCDPFSSNTVSSSVLQITCLFTNSRLLSFHVPSKAIHIQRSSILPYCRRTFSPSRPGLESWNIQSRT